MGNLIDLTGQRFGRVVVLHYIPKSNPTSWICRCDCGKKKAIRGDGLRSGSTHSCGCLNLEKLRGNKRNWSGDAIEYRGLHDRLNPLLPNKGICAFCGQTGITELANISHVYKTTLDDWMWLCRLCHKRYDSGWEWRNGIWLKICKGCNTKKVVDKTNFYQYKATGKNFIQYSTKCKKCEIDRKSY